VKAVQTLRGVDINSDHNLVVVKICTRLKIIKVPKGKSKKGSGEVIP
jgi:hypothetical protein